MGQVVHHCKTAAEWVQANKQLFAARVEMPEILNMDSTQTEEAAREMAKLFDDTMDPNEGDKESILDQ